MKRTMCTHVDGSPGCRRAPSPSSQPAGGQAEFFPFLFVAVTIYILFKSWAGLETAHPHCYLLAPLRLTLALVP